MELKPGTLLYDGKYEIIKPLGQGGFGITYLAHHTLLDHDVCIKEFFMKNCCDRDGQTSQISLGTSSNAEMVLKYQEKFMKEARIIFKLSHPNIVHIHDIFKENNTAYYVTDFIDGSNLDAVVKSRGALPESQAVRYVKAVAEGLAYCHSKSIAHLDIKPGNIMLRSDDTPVIIDFGLSKQYDSVGEQTSNTPVGVSAGYAPIEQYNSGGVSEFSPQTDVYALGATLYRLVTGSVPPAATDLANDGLPALPASLSASTRAAIENAMQFRKKDRPSSMYEFLSILEGSSFAPSAVSSPDDTTTLISVGPSRPASQAPSPEPRSKAPSYSPKKSGPSAGLPKWALGVIGGIVLCAVVAGALIFKSPHDYVDLGLSVKWATCNVGASKPEDYGGYYQWAGTKDVKSTSINLDWSNCPYHTGSDENTGWTKYVWASQPFYWSGTGSPDGKTLLDPSDDVARVVWKGSWRMPTHSEFDELVKNENCSWTWTSINGINGYKVQSKKPGYTDNWIFLPAAGRRRNGKLEDVQSTGRYWAATILGSSTLNGDILYLSETSHNSAVSNLRYYGNSVRPVTE